MTAKQIVQECMNGIMSELEKVRTELDSLPDDVDIETAVTSLTTNVANKLGSLGTELDIHYQEYLTKCELNKK